MKSKGGGRNGYVTLFLFFLFDMEKGLDIVFIISTESN